METKISSICCKTWRIRWCEPRGRRTPGRERSTRSRAPADSAAPASTDLRRSSIVDSTCARIWFSSWPTARLSCGVAGLSQLSVMSASTPDLRPSQASRNRFQEDSSSADKTSLSKRARISANSAGICAGSLTARAASVCSDLFRASIFVSNIAPSWGAAVLRPCGKSIVTPASASRKSLGPKKKGRLPLRLFLGWRGSGFRLLRQLFEGAGIEYRHVRQDLTVQGNPGGFQTMNQLAVGKAVLARGGSDALNPQLAVFSLFYASVAKGITIGAIGRFLSGLIELALGEKKAFCAFEILLTAGAALGAAFYACHGFLLFISETNEVRSDARHCAGATGLSRILPAA